MKGWRFLTRMTGLVGVGLLALPLISRAQPGAALSLDSAVAGALRASPLVRQSTEGVREQAALRRASFSLLNPGVIVENPGNGFFTVGGQQTFEFPTVYARQARLARAQVTLAEQSGVLAQNAVRRETRLAYLDLQIVEARLRQLQTQDSLTRALAAASERLFAAGEVNALQRVSTQAEARQATNRVAQAEADRAAAQRRLTLLLNRTNAAPLRTGTDLTRPAATPLTDTLRLVTFEAGVDTTAISRNPALAVAAEAVRVGELNRRLTRARALPGLTVGYLNQGPRDAPFRDKLQGGISLPLYFWQYRAQNRAAEARLRAAQAGREATTLDTRRELAQAVADARKFAASLRYYAQTGLPQAATITRTAQRLFGAGDVSYYVLIQSLQQAAQIRTDYLDAVRGYRQALIQLDFLQGQ
jgi:outer membrane protein, heavy metal efflux system